MESLRLVFYGLLADFLRPAWGYLAYIETYLDLCSAAIDFEQDEIVIVSTCDTCYDSRFAVLLEGPPKFGRLLRKAMDASRIMVDPYLGLSQWKNRYRGNNKLVSL